MKEEWKGLNLVDLMELLEPVPEPGPISMVPQTAGWLWLGIAILVLIFGIAWSIHRHWIKNAYRRQALNELDQLPEDLTVLSTLLRRTALAAYPRKRVASLYGNDWLEFLDRTSCGTEFTEGRGKVLACGPYSEEMQSEDLKPLVRTWIKAHRGDPA